MNLARFANESLGIRSSDVHHNTAASTRHHFKKSCRHDGPSDEVSAENKFSNFSDCVWASVRNLLDWASATHLDERAERKHVEPLLGYAQNRLWYYRRSRRWRGHGCSTLR